MKRRSIKLHNMVLKRNHNINIMANFDVQFVLNKMETFLKSKPILLDQKRAVTVILRGK